MADLDLKNATYGVPMVSLDAMAAAASYVYANWGEHGYRIGVVKAWTDGAGIFGVRCLDGSEFFVRVDRNGTVSTVEPATGRRTP